MISRTHEVPNLIGGERVGAADGATFERRNPADARQVVSVAPESTAADVTDAVSAAVDALRTWRTTSPTARSNVLSAAARLLACPRGRPGRRDGLRRGQAIRRRS